MSKILFFQANAGVANGVSAYVRQLSTRLQGHHECHVAAYAPARDVVQLADYYRVPTANMALMPAGRERQLQWSILRRLAEEVRARKIDVIHAHTLRAAALAGIVKLLFRLRVRTVYTNHGLRYRQLPLSLARVRAYLAERIVMRMHDATVFVTETEMAAAGSLAGVHRSVLIKTRTDIEPALPRSVPKTLEVIAVGPIGTEKGADRFAEIALRVREITPNVSFTWIGRGCGTSPAVNWVGERAHADVLASMQSAFLYLFCSRIDTYPMAVLEAYASGLPVMFVTDYEHGSYKAQGMYTVTAAGIDEAVRYIHELTHDHERWGLMSSLAIAWYRENAYGSQRLAEEYDAVYASLASDEGVVRGTDPS